MTDFSVTTPFRLVRGLATAGPKVPSLYLLIAETAAMDAIRADLAAEIQVQLGIEVRCLTASEVQLKGLEDTSQPAVLITLDSWTPKLVESLDLHVVLLTRSGTVLLLASRAVADRILAEAPNLRSRFVDVLAIRPDEAFGGVRT